MLIRSMVRHIPVIALLMMAMVLSSGTALADVTYTDYIDIRASSIAVQITETYTGGDAAIIEREIAESDDRSTYIREAESNILAWSRSYIIVDDDPLQTETERVDVDVTNISGSFLINSTLEYAVATPLDHGRHSIWIQGHPGVASRTIILPDDIDMESIVGIRESEIVDGAGYTMITGVSATREFMSNGRPTFEYATVVKVCKRPIHTQPWFLPLLAAIEVTLISLWWVCRKKQ